MARLHEQLQYFVNKKLATDPSWQKVEVILSGQDVRLRWIHSKKGPELYMCSCSSGQEHARDDIIAIPLCQMMSSWTFVTDQWLKFNMHVCLVYRQTQSTILASRVALRISG